MLLAERCESERLRQIIKELQRHRFGRRAETLPEDQMLLGLEDVEQVAAYGETAQDVSAPEGREVQAGRRRVNRGAFAGAPAADRSRRRHRGQDLSLLPGRVTPDRRG
ncbi:transposase domain-containing protein [Bradyrhizobium septentrionale]|uniref:transposase domain-containing protein n=1 Tax=Bradyrhizobium septentrionale TaxID=1404411 RepID=UPI003B8A69BC